MLEFYWAMGRDVSEMYKHARYGSAFFDCLSLDLKEEFPEQMGFSSANIRYTKRWYEFYSQGDGNLQRLVEDFNSKNLHQAGEEFNSKNRQQLADDWEMPIEFGLIPWGHLIDIIQWWNGHSAV